MSYQITWSIPHRVVMLTQFGPVSAQEAELAAQQVYEAMDSEPTAPIHFLVDARNASMSDKLWNYAQLKFKRHTRSGFIIVIGDSRLIGLFIALISKTLNLHIHYQSTPDAALQFLQERDAMVAEHFA
jgi:hypothetical protein